MPKLIPEPALPVDTDGMLWIATGPGKSFRPLPFAADGWSELKITGTIEYLDDSGQVIESVNAGTQRAVYLAWCRAHDVPPSGRILG